MDFKISNTGEINPVDDTLINYDDYRLQLAKSRIISVDKDWYYDNIGANLEELFGTYIVPNSTENIFVNKIINSLMIDDAFNYNNIYVECYHDYKTMSLDSKVYLKNINTTNDSKSGLIEINLDLFNSNLMI